jgi:hypothetical protein
MPALEDSLDQLHAAELHAAARSLRSCVFDLLKQAAMDGLSASAPLSEAMSRLQAAGNELGEVERLLENESGHDARTAQQRKEDAPSAPPGPAPSRDAATALALASAVIPLASSANDEAERWVRILAPHGRVGSALRAVGISSYQLPTIADDPDATRSRTAGGSVDRVSALAIEFAREHEAKTVDTVHVLFAVLAVHGRRFDRALYMYGSTRQDLLEALASGIRLRG